MDQIEAIRTRRRRADLDSLSFQQHAKSDIDHLLALVDALTPKTLERAPFDVKTVFRDTQGHLCVPLKKRLAN